MVQRDMRSPLARAIGLGSAGAGVGPWWAERVSTVALVPLTLWFAASIIAHVGSDYAAFIAWMRSPLAATSMILLLIELFHHTALGLQVVIEDYVHSRAIFAWEMALRSGCFTLAVAGIVATLHIAFARCSKRCQCQCTGMCNRLGRSKQPHRSKMDTGANFAR